MSCERCASLLAHVEALSAELEEEKEELARVDNQRTGRVALPQGSEG